MHKQMHRLYKLVRNRWASVKLKAEMHAFSWWGATVIGKTQGNVEHIYSKWVDGDSNLEIELKSCVLEKSDKFRLTDIGTINTVTSPSCGELLW